MPLQFSVFFSERPGVSRTTPPGKEHLEWVPTTSTLIYGATDAVLVDTQLTERASQDLAKWVVEFGKKLTTIYITHGHGDHFFGTAALLHHYPDAKVVATPEVVAHVENQRSPAVLGTLWEKLFPGQLPSSLLTAAALSAGEDLTLEGERLVVVPTGHTDTDNTTTLWVPSIGLAVTGDAVYNNTHPYMRESASQEARREWIVALGRIAALQPINVVGGHSDPRRGFDPRSIQETKSYLHDLERLDHQTDNAVDLYHQMLELHPDRLNVGSLWGAASLLKQDAQVPAVKGGEVEDRKPDMG
ncbi:hypothetical protein B0A55_12903 [Friedmanniomyces simplex]|uniref:Metallo-beta-lactamase domain-containing protein n=1 Tax=Friedmanniomyces simplex TaxID=329884 RepID=A0A4U0WKG9_9PEZI|nr:hypothetical protein B0A55_12903 [Friedmanniomyces simplex]